MHRKEFIKTCCITCISGSVFATFLQGCVSVNYFAQSSISNNQIIIKKTEFLKTEKNNTIQRKYVLVKIEKYNYPFYVNKISEENYSALLMECTHKSCELNPHGDYLVCPCHGSEFTNLGVVQNPPADKNLKSFKITSDNENIYIQL